jgi:hypothetical protein
MLPKRVQVLKHHRVQVSGSVCLSPVGGAARTGSPPRAGASRAPMPQQARVVESNSEYAIIEVTCSCGSKTHVQCNYAHLTEGSQRS